MHEPFAPLSFSGEVVEWRGPAPFFFVPVPEELVGEVHFAAREASYGWGCVPVEVRIGETDFTTSLFPRGESYMVPVKLAVRKAEDIASGDRIAVTLTVAARRR